MRTGWEVKKAGDIFEMTDFVSNGSFASLRENVEYLDHPDYAVLVRLADFSNGFDSSRFVYVSKQSYDYLAKSKLFGGEIIMSNVGSVGKSFICPDLGCPMTIGPNAILIRSENNPFYQYYFLTEEFQKKLLSISSKATLLKFNKTNFKTLDIPVPSLPEQQRIVDILDREFAKIDALKANAEKSLQAARDLFQATLKKELEPKTGWKGLAIPEISENLDYKRVPITKSVRENGQYPYYGASGIVDYVADYIFDEPLLLVSEDGANLLARSTPIAFSIEGKVWVNNHAHVLRFDDSKKQKFVEYWFAGNDISSLITGTAQPKFNQKALNSIKIAFPVKEQEMESILNRLDEMEEKSNALQENYQKTLTLCDDLKQSLLRKAFNGEL